MRRGSDLGAGLLVTGFVCAGIALASCGGDDTAENPTSSSTAAGTGGATSSSSSSSSSSSTSSASSSAASTGVGGQGGAGGAGGTGGGSTGDWSCLNNVMWPAPVNPTVMVQITFVHFMSTTPYPGLAVKACAKADTTCAAPLDTQTADANGVVVLTLPTGTAGFDGFADITGADIPNSLAFVFPYVASDKQVSLPLIGQSEIALFSGLLGIQLDPLRGHVAANVFDCSFDTGAAGVSVTADTADANTTQVYVSGVLPSKTATETDATGITGFFNLPPGPVKLGATINATSQTVGGISVLARANTITYTTFPPTP